MNNEKKLKERRRTPVGAARHKTCKVKDCPEKAWGGSVFCKKHRRDKRKK